MNHAATQRQMQNTMVELESSGFQPLGELVAQGLGFTGKALSADGSTWAAIGTLRSNLRGSLRQLLKTGVLRGAGCSAQFTTEFNNRTYLVTTTADLAPAPGILVERVPAETALAEIAQLHMQRIENHMRQRQPLRPLIHTCAEEIEAAQQRAQMVRAPQPLTVEALRELGIPPRLALLIAGDCAEAPETLSL